MRVLVTGSAGFVAGHLNMAGHRWLGLDIKEGFDICAGSTAKIVEDFDPEVVYHLAAHHYIPWTQQHPFETTLLNVSGTGMMLAACGPSLKAFVLASSAAVYGFSPHAIDETHSLSGKDGYARSKISAEALLMKHAEGRPGVRYVAARLFNVVGACDPWPHALPEIIRQRNETVRLGNDWPQRDYVHADDVADALQFLGAHAPLGFSAWNVGTGIGTSVRELVERVAERARRPISVETAPGRIRSDDGHLVCDPTSLALLGWKAKHTLTEAIDDALRCR